MNERRILQSAVAVFILIGLSMIWPREDASAPGAESSGPARASASAGADFDFYILVLSWSPTHCASEEGRGRDDDLQCRSGRPHGFVLHGLWPQREQNYPEYCESNEPGVVAEAIVREALKVTPSRQLIQHEWDRHGTCSGLGQRGYFSAAAAAFDAIEIPPAYSMLSGDIATTPEDVRSAFLEANPRLRADGVAATCRRGELAEMWFCLDRSLGPRACSAEVRKKHCGARKVKMRAMRGNRPG